MKYFTERMDYNYVANTMRLELVTFMEEWAKNLIETELLVESEELHGEIKL